MILSYFFILLAGLSGVVYGACFKISASQGFNRKLFLLGFSVFSLILVLIYIVIGGSGFHAPGAFGLGVLYGLSMTISMYFYLVTAAKVRLGIAWTLIQMSVVVPLFFSIVYYDEVLNTRHILGLAILLLSVITMGLGKKTTGKTPPAVIAGLVISILFTGISQCFPKIYVSSGGENPMMLVFYGRLPGILIFALLLLRELRDSSLRFSNLIQVDFIGLGVIMALAGIFLPFFLMLGLVLLPGSVAFPLRTIINILGGAAVSRLYFKDRFSIWEYAGIIISLPGIALIL